LGYEFFGPSDSTLQTKENLTHIDTLRKSLPSNDRVAEADTVHPNLKKEANTMLQNQLNAKHQVAYEDVKVNALGSNGASTSLSDTQLNLMTQAPAADDKLMANWYEAKKEDKEELNKNVEVYISKDSKVSSAKKEAPLVVIDNKATDLDSLVHLNPETIDSLEILKEPLYIINGIYYTEKEVFGPNPTSPYTPLDQQDIESISILKDEKAAALYGEKGKKGVVIIHTKDGKPKGKNTVKPYLDKSKWPH